MATMMAIIDPGDEVIVFEPFYENYGPDAIVSGATPRYAKLREPARHCAGQHRLGARPGRTGVGVYRQDHARSF